MKIDFVPVIKDWIHRRVAERTTWDGIVLVAAGVAYLVFKPIAGLVAYGAIAYGVWTIWKKEK
jgi:hypothetical protein